MNSNGIEQYAVNAVADYINLSEHLSPFINVNDKEPTWDGSIYICRVKGKKEETRRIPVQVKGTEKGDLSKNKISFRMSIIDLENYLRDGGCMLFVVYVAHDKLNAEIRRQIYYANLTPIKLNGILNSAKKRARTTNVSLKKVPKSIAEMEDIVLNCYDNVKRQTSFATKKIPSFDEIYKNGLAERFFIPLSSFSNVSPADAILKNDVYVYAQIKGMEAPVPVDIIVDNKFISYVDASPVSVKNIVYYDSYDIIERDNVSEIIIGRGIIVTWNAERNDLHIEYKHPCMLRDYVNIKKFLIAASENGGFDVGKLHINIKIKSFDIEVEKRRLEPFEKAVKLLEVMNCEEDTDVFSLNEEDMRRLNLLVGGILDKKPVCDRKSNAAEVMYMDIGDLKFIVGFDRTDKAGVYMVNDLNDVDAVTVAVKADGRKITVPKYFIFEKDDLLKISNIPFNKLITQFKALDGKNSIYEVANCFLIKLIAAYDEARGKRKERLLSTAREFAEWLAQLPENAFDARVTTINKLQIAKRTRELSESEKDALYEISESNCQRLDIMAGAALLLGERERAKRYFSRMSNEEQEAFQQMPIAHFW